MHLPTSTRALTAPLGLAIALAAAPGCKGQTEQSVCQTMCLELVATCEYDAFPTQQSCEQGCNYSAEQGADIAGQSECVTAAACDTFAILECEHAYGPQ